MKALLAVVVALDVPVLGTISDAQECARLALPELWPTAPHQVCQSDVLRDLLRKAFKADKQAKTAFRTRLPAKVRALCKQIKKYLASVSSPEVGQLAIINEDATGIVTARNTGGLQPLR
jgi:hypothetical protein